MSNSLQNTQALIRRHCDAICELLCAKSQKYGNAARNPAMIFSKANPLDQIAVRCDDKLRRIGNMGGLVKVIADAKHAEEDTVLDLIGYLILARVVHQELQEAADGKSSPP